MIPFSDEELIEPVKIVLNKVRPMLLRDGGDLSFIKIENGCVFVRLEGACKGCSSANITLKNGIERALKNEICEEIEVKNVSV